MFFYGGHLFPTTQKEKKFDIYKVSVINIENSYWYKIKNIPASSAFDAEQGYVNYIRIWDRGYARNHTFGNVSGFIQRVEWWNNREIAK